jgi:hypothetical protein
MLANSPGSPSTWDRVNRVTPIGGEVTAKFTFSDGIARTARKASFLMN